VQSKRLIAICLLAFILVVAIFVPLAAAAAEEAATPAAAAAEEAATPAAASAPAPTHDPSGTIAGNVKDVTAVLAVMRIRTGETGAEAI